MNASVVAGTGAMIENRTFDEIAIGDSAALSRTLSPNVIVAFAAAVGDRGTVHGDEAGESDNPSHYITASGTVGAGLIAAVLDTRLPGPGTEYIAQDLQFLHPMAIGDTITTTVTVTQKHVGSNTVELDCRCTNPSGQVVIIGTSRVRAPTAKVSRARSELPELSVGRHERFHALLGATSQLEPLVTAVAHPCDATVLGAVVEAVQARLINPILVGPALKIRKAAEAGGVDISAFRLVDVPHSHAAAAEAVALVQRGEAALLMKGSLHTDELLRAVLALESGLRTERRMSHVYLMDVPGYPRPLLVTDAAVNIAPDLEQKRDIVQNAIDLARVMGIATPRVAILSAVETVNPKLSSTLDAAALCKMADRGQITGGIVDGPLAFDNALYPAAAKEKGIVSAVAGFADILVVPDLVAGNMLAKQLIYLAGADAAGVVVGARVPIILTSRADSERTRLASCAVAVLMARSQVPTVPKVAEG